MKKHLSKELVDFIREKSSLKQDVFFKVKETFELFKHQLANSIEECSGEVCELDSRVKFSYRKKGEYECEIMFGGDALVFHHHSNVFQFDQTSSLWKTGYVKADSTRAYVGVINVYNFLADSLRFGRKEDIGYLIARIFINKEGHYYVQGKGDLGVKHNNFGNTPIDQTAILDIIESCIRFSLNFDLLIPPYEAVQSISVSDILSTQEQITVATGKRLGFKFSFDDKDSQ